MLSTRACLLPEHVSRQKSFYRRTKVILPSRDLRVSEGHNTGSV
jgi:hypothetical protein